MPRGMIPKSLSRQHHSRRSQCLQKLIQLLRVGVVSLLMPTFRKGEERTGSSGRVQRSDSGSGCRFSSDREAGSIAKDRDRA